MTRHSRFPAINRDQPPISEHPDLLDLTDPDAEEDLRAIDDLPRYNGIDIAEMTVNEVFKWVGSNPQRRAYAVLSEINGHGRKGIVKGLGADED